MSVPSVTPLLSSQQAAGLGTNALRGTYTGEKLSKVFSSPSWSSTPSTARRNWPGAQHRGQGPLGNPVARVLVTDAVTGAPIDAWDSLETATGDGKSLYSGTVPLNTSQGDSGTSCPTPAAAARTPVTPRTRPTCAS